MIAGTAARFWTLSSTRWANRLFFDANSSRYDAAATPSGIASSAVVPMTQAVPRMAARAPAVSGAICEV